MIIIESKNLVKININDYIIETRVDYPLIKALELLKISVPRFCYHPQLSIAGNCRMCLIEVKNSIKPVASCAVHPSQNMSIYTDTRLVKEARENVMEFLLINHPLDCPICDQGGECDLQDISFVFGTDRGRFYEKKRSVINKYAGPFIKMIMTRCIHCTRCTRFFEEYVGKPFFGVVNRGEFMEIDTYVKNIIDSEISGTVIDLCPVGALTSKVGAFIARPWELHDCYTIDILDSYCSEIRIDLKDNNEIVRIVPKLIENDYNSFIITDKIRFMYKLLNNMCYEYPSILNFNNIYYKCTSEYIATYISFYIRNFKYKFLGLGKFIDYTVLLFIKKIKKNVNFSIINDYQTLSHKLYQLNKLISSNNKNFFGLINQTLHFDVLNSLIILNCNLRYELPILNARIRNFSLRNKNNFIGLYGNVKNNYINYRYIHLSNNMLYFHKFCLGKTWVSFKFIFNRLIEYTKISQDNYKVDCINYNIILAGSSLNISFIYNQPFIYKFIKNIFINLNKYNLISNYYTYLIILQNDISYMNSIYLNIYGTLTSFFKLYALSRHDEINYKVASNLYYGINIDVINFSSFYKGFGLKIYQGLFIENIADKLHENNIKIILPVKSWLEYKKGITFDFKGSIKQFFKVYSKTKILQHPVNYLVNFTTNLYKHYKYQEYISLSIKQPNLLDIDDNALALQTWLNDFNYIQNYFYWWMLYKKDKKTVLDFSQIFLETYISFNETTFNFIEKIKSNKYLLINIYDDFYKNDLFSKISLTLTMSHNLTQKLDNF